MTLWIIGWMFAVGLFGLLRASAEKRIGTWAGIGYMLLLMIVWPLFLGMFTGDCISGPEIKENEDGK